MGWNPKGEKSTGKALSGQFDDGIELILVLLLKPSGNVDHLIILPDTDAGR